MLSPFDPLRSLSPCILRRINLRCVDVVSSLEGIIGVESSVKWESTVATLFTITFFSF